ncbi:secretion protein EspA [Candidatus Arsenophonus triatominarum]|uniref:secretion protein EspA n=1 Tax=Candidatus Arsenophonus triatominarum TaxID=57911 RepID=UPI0007C555CB|nr:secretion protein EspA [Candidatus Arsenophonus triatominarum]
MSTQVLNTSSNYSVNAGALNGIKDASAIYNDPVLSDGIAVLYTFMSLLSDIAKQKYAQMQHKADVSRSAQDMANQVDEIIAGVSKKGDKATDELPEAVIDYMRKNGISVDGMSIDDYIKKHGDKLDQGQLQAVKAALETVSNRASDFVSQSQLQLQKVMQSYSVTVGLINSMQTMLAEMNKSIAQNIR